jgi:hypothetical protein
MASRGRRSSNSAPIRNFYRGGDPDLPNRGDGKGRGRCSGGGEAVEKVDRFFSWIKTRFAYHIYKQYLFHAGLDALFRMHLPRKMITGGSRSTRAPASILKTFVTSAQREIEKALRVFDSKRTW